MTPVNIVGSAVLGGLDFVAIADHNTIAHVPVALKAGKEYGIKVVPAIELQTREDVHVVCLFERYEDLVGFVERIPFSQRPNQEEFFGEQLIFDEDDEVVGKEERMLLDSADLSCNDVPMLIKEFNGVAIPAHIDREGNSMLSILGTIVEGFPVVEFSTRASQDMIEEWSKTHGIVIDSDAHTLESIATRGQIELEEYTVKSFLDHLRG
jgi:hypothetical protein